MKRQSWLPLAVLVAVIPVVYGCTDEPPLAPSVASEITPSFARSPSAGIRIATIHGQVEFVEPKSRIRLHLFAQQKTDKDGSTSIRGHARNGLSGDVVGLATPSEAYDYWCVNVAVNEIPGFNFLWYIKDVGDGHSTFDETATNGGFGETCASLPEPAESFAPVGKGDFKTMIH